jgi:hypothetical protein
MGFTMAAVATITVLALHMAGADSASAGPRRRPRPVVVNMGSVDVGNICEQTPVLIDGEMWRFENVHPLYHASLTPGANYQRFVHVKTGATTPPFGAGYALGSAFVDGETVYAYGTFCNTTDACGAPTSNREVRVWWSTDRMQTWQSATALNATGLNYTLWNTSVDRAKLNGTELFVMAFETDDKRTPGGWNTMFATAPSPRGPWTVLEIDRFSMPVNVEHADPTIRFIRDKQPSILLPGSGWFYVMSGRASLSTACADDKGRYFMEIYRSRDLLSWEPSAGMGTPTMISGMIEPNASLDRRPAVVEYSTVQRPYLEAHYKDEYMDNTTGTEDTWTDCNASDMDLCELEGKT